MFLMCQTCKYKYRCIYLKRVNEYEEAIYKIQGRLPFSVRIELTCVNREIVKIGESYEGERISEESD